MSETWNKFKDDALRWLFGACVGLICFSFIRIQISIESVEEHLEGLTSTIQSTRETMIELKGTVNANTEAIQRHDKEIESIRSK